MNARAVIIGLVTSVSMFSLGCNNPTSSKTQAISQEITVLYPNGGETFKLGDTVNIRWKKAADVPSVVIYLTTDNGKSYNGPIETKGSISDTVYSWEVNAADLGDPDSSEYPLTQCKVSVREYGQETTNDLSDNNFTITNK